MRAASAWNWREKPRPSAASALGAARALAGLVLPPSRLAVVLASP